MSVTSKRTPKVSGFEYDQMLIRKTFAQFPSGVVVMAAEHEGEKHAMVASSFMVGVSLDPVLVAVAIQKNSETWPTARLAPTIGISAFGAGQGALVRQLAGKDRERRFDEVAVEVNESGAIYIEDAAMWLETRIHNESDAGDHWMVLLEVTRLGVDDNMEPLLWHGSRFREFAAEEPVEV
jgi:flavin reductase (DIM6/NTAB) family NADH-FMN oxidoreductase RutF